MRQRSLSVLLGVLVLAVGAAYWWTTRDSADAPLRNAGKGAATAGANSGAAAGTGAAAGPVASTIRALDPNAPGAMPGQLQAAAASATARPRGGRFDRLAELQARNSLAAAIREAAGTDDPAAHSFVLEMVDFCLRNTAAKTKAQATAVSYVPARLRATTAKDTPELFRDAAERTRMQESNRAMLESCSEFNLANAKVDVDSAVQKLAARGATLPAVMSLMTSQFDLGSLTVEQFDIVSRALTERDVGTLAVLGQVLQPLMSNIMANRAPATITDARYYGDVNAPLAWQLALCQLGAPCGHDSLWARDACFYYGACTGEDLASALRAALTRDGLNPALLDKQAEQYLRAITGGDPMALGLRRKKP